MGKVLGVIGILSGVGFGFIAVSYGDALPQAKIPFLIFALVLIVGGVALMMPWHKILGTGEKAPEEEIEVINAKDSPSGQSIVRIPLDGVDTPVKNKGCYLVATLDGMELLDTEGGVLTTIPIDEAITRIHFPSFWTTSYLKIEWEDKDLPYFFHPKKDAVYRIRRLLERSLKTHPEQVIATMRRKGIVGLLVGAGCLVLGIGITFVSFAAAAPNGRFFIMTGLIVFGLFSIGRGIYWMLQVSHHKSALARE